MPEVVTCIFKPGHKLIDSGMVCCLKPAIAELIQGAKKEKGVNVMKDLADVFPLLAGWHLISPVEEGGQEIGVNDCYIGTVAEENDAMICALDRHFKEIQSHIDITFLGRRDGSRAEHHNSIK
ncbi:hypothetical protein ES703_35542 [subsurface metagenome]